MPWLYRARFGSCREISGSAFCFKTKHSGEQKSCFLKRWFSPGRPLADGCAVGGVPAAACARSQAGSLHARSWGSPAVLASVLASVPAHGSYSARGSVTSLQTGCSVPSFVLGAYPVRIGFGGPWS